MKKKWNVGVAFNNECENPLPTVLRQNKEEIGDDETIEASQRQTDNTDHKMFIGQEVVRSRTSIP